jgi:anti-sigma B factor antagonist
MNIEIKNEDSRIYAVIEGRLDTANAVACEKELQPLKDNADKEIVIDCTNLEYISSSGLRLFLSLRKTVAAKGGKMTVENINDDIRNVFTITGFFKLFDIRP